MLHRIRTPKLRSVLLGMLIMVALLLFLLHRGAQQGVANSKATGLGAVATGWDPISLWKQDTFASKIRRMTTSGIVGGVPGGTKQAKIRSEIVASDYLQAEESAKPQKKIVRTVSLDLLVHDARQAASQIERIAYVKQGEVEKAEVRNSGATSQSGELTLRVPSDELDNIVGSFRTMAIRVQNEHWESRDVTREFMDSEARLRNMKAEEQQYLVLLRRTGSMKDTLQVTEKISEVRGEIEQLQGELNWWSHQVAMSAIQISLNEEPQAMVAARWRPLYNAKNAAHEMLLGLGEWVDWAVAFLINIPLILIWVCSVGGLIWVGWKSLRWVWIRWLKPAPQAAITS